MRSQIARTARGAKDFGGVDPPGVIACREPFDTPEKHG